MVTASEPDRLQARSVPVFFLLPGEDRIHVHVVSPDGEAKYWLEPTVSLATFEGLNATQLKRLQRMIEEHSDEIRTAWRRHFRR